MSESIPSATSSPQRTTSTLPITFLLLLSTLCLLVSAELPREFKDSRFRNEELQDALKHLTPEQRQRYEKDAQGDDSIYMFFAMHDHDKNHKLDGHEMRNAVMGFPDYDIQPGEHRQTMEEIDSMIDHVLEQDDANNDGYIDWTEYLSAQMNDH